MWETYAEYVSWQNDVILATTGHDYGPQFGPAEPREYDGPSILPCGHSWEDCDGGCDYEPEEPDEERITEADIAW